MHTTPMPKKELRAAETVAKVGAGKMTAVEAAAALGATDRTVRRMKRKMRGGGIAALAHKGRGLVGNRAMPKAERRKVEKPMRERHPDFRPGLAAEQLREPHGIDRDPKTAASAGHEGVLPTLAFWRRYAERPGLPEAPCLDKVSTYRVNDGVAAENQDTRTQFGRVMALLGVKVVFANSPQAKGRVERLFRTPRDRLVKELRLRKMSTVEAANRFLRGEFLPDFNRRFGRPAREAGDRHRKLTPEERRRLGQVFCRGEWRTLANDFTVPHGRLWYQLLKTPRAAPRPKDGVCVRTEPDGSVTLWVRERGADYRVIEKGRGAGPETENH
jgi:hypothetical protein